MAEENFSAVNKTLKETTDFLKKKSAQDAAEAAKTRAVLEKTAASTGKSLKDIKDRASAKLQIKKQDEANALASENKSATMKLLGVSQKRMDKADKLSIQIQAQEKIMAEQKLSLEESGLDAEKVPKFQKAQLELDKLKAKKDKTLGAADSEDSAKQAAKDGKMMTYMKNTAGFLGGIAKQGMQKVKSGLSGFAKFAFGGLAIAALSFLNSPLFDKYYDQIVNVVIPKLVEIYNKILKPLAKYIGGKLKKLFKDILDVVDGKKGIGELIKENLGTLTALAAVLAPKTFFGTLLTGAKLATGLVKAGFSSKMVTGAFAKLAPALKFAIGPAALVAGIAMAAKDGIEAYKKAGDWDVSKTSAVVGGIFGGQESKGFVGTASNMGKNALKWAAIGAAAGSVIPVIGTAIGGAVGALIGAVLGYFGGDVIAKAIDDMATAVSDFFSDLVKKFKNFFAAAFPKVAKFFGMSEKDVGKAAEENAKDMVAVQNRRQLEMDKVRGGGDAEKGRLMREERAFSQKERQLAKDIKFAQKDVDHVRTGVFGVGAESKEEQEKDRKLLESLEKQIAELRLEREKQIGSVTNNVDASNKDFSQGKGASTFGGGGGSISNPNPVIDMVASGMGN